MNEDEYRIVFVLAQRVLTEYKPLSADEVPEWASQLAESVCELRD